MPHIGRLRVVVRVVQLGCMASDECRQYFMTRHLVDLMADHSRKCIRAA